MSLLVASPTPNSPHTLTTNLSKKEAFVLGHLRLQGEGRRLQVKGHIKAAGPSSPQKLPYPLPRAQAFLKLKQCPECPPA